MNSTAFDVELFWIFRWSHFPPFLGHLSSLRQPQNSSWHSKHTANRTKEEKSKKHDMCIVENTPKKPLQFYSPLTVERAKTLRTRHWCNFFITLCANAAEKKKEGRKRERELRRGSADWNSRSRTKTYPFACIHGCANRNKKNWMALWNGNTRQKKKK